MRRLMVRLGLLLALAALALLQVGGAPGTIPVTGSPPGLFDGLYPGDPSARVTSPIPSLEAFSRSLSIDGADAVVGVFVREKLAFRVLDQPVGQPAFVTTQRDAVSHFSLAQSYGTIGLIAHNSLAGQTFFGLREGDRIVVLKADGARKFYVVTEIRRLQALSPLSSRSAFRDLQAENRVLSAKSLFDQVYGGAHPLVLQTCISANGNAAWGRLFVLARPARSSFQIAVTDKLTRQIAQID